MGAYLIVGGSSGIGAACAERLSREGHLVALVARDVEKLKSLAAKLPTHAECFGYDLENVKEIRSIFDFCKEKSLKLDGMVYAAGMNADVPMKVCEPDLMERVMRVNCIAFAQMGKFFYSKRYSNDFSRIVAISSSASQSFEKGMGPYNASKAALNAVVKTMSKEFVKRGVLVNAVLPAGVMTPMAAEKIEKMTGKAVDVERAIRELEQMPVPIRETEAQPFGIIPPSFVAEIVSYLVSARNRYVTGALIPISAGLNF